MATQEKTWNVANRLHSLKDSDKPEVNHIIAGADEIYDDAKGEKQSNINAQADAALADRYTKAETYSKEQLDALITTPDVNYVTVATFADLPQTGEANTVYRVSSYDGTQVDASKYTLYAWNGTSYQLLAVRSAVGEVFDVSEYSSGATYETLTAAIAAVPAGVQRGGMSIKFILRTNTGTKEEPVYHDEYVQYRLMNTAWSTVVADWQGVDSEPTAGSRNLVESGGIEKRLNSVVLKGANATYVYIRRKLVQGRRYSLIFLDTTWSTENIDNTSMFHIQSIGNNGSLSSLVRYRKGDDLPQVINFTVPEDSVRISIGGSADIGSEIQFYIIDSHEVFELYSELNNEVGKLSSKVSEHDYINNFKDEVVDYKILNNFIAKTGKWEYGTNKHGILNVKYGDVYFIFNESTENDFIRFAFVESENYRSGTDVPLFPNTSIITVMRGTYEIAIVPYGCNLMVFNKDESVYKSKVFKSNILQHPDIYRLISENKTAVGNPISLDSGDTILLDKPYRLTANGSQDIAGVAEISVHGRTVVWNQLYNDNSLSLDNNHTYYIREKLTNNSINKKVLTGDEVTYTDGSTERMCIDLSLLYGNLNENPTVEEFESYFLLIFGREIGYEPQSSPHVVSCSDNITIISSSCNLMRREKHSAYINASGNIAESRSCDISDYIRVKGGYKYYFDCVSTTAGVYMAIYNNLKELIEIIPSSVYGGKSVIEMPSNAHYIRVTVLKTKKDGIVSLYNPENIYTDNDNWECKFEIPIANGIAIDYHSKIYDLKGISDVCDKLYKYNGITKYVKRIDTVKMRSLSWSMRPSGMFVAVVLRKPSSGGKVMCERYVQDFVSGFESNGKDFSMSSSFIGQGNSINIKDSRYNNIEDFVDSLGDMILYYELGTQEEYTAINLAIPNLIIEPGGTEEVYKHGDNISSCIPAIYIKYGTNVKKYIENAIKNYEKFPQYIRTIDEGGVFYTIDNFIAKRTVENEIEYLHFSDDLGKTWKTVENTFDTKITHMHYFVDGTLLLCTSKKCFWSKDFENFTESTVYDYDGSIFTPGENDTRFYMIPKPKMIQRTFVNGDEWHLWGDYIISTTTKPRLWYSNDNGRTIRAAFAYGLSEIDGVIYRARHIHAFEYNKYDGFFYAFTGDGTRECHILKGKYNNGNWNWEHIVTGGIWKLTSPTFFEGYFCAVTDYTETELYDKKGIIKCPTNDIREENITYLFKASRDLMGSKALSGYISNEKNGWKVIFPDFVGGYQILIAKNDYDFKWVDTESKVAGAIGPNNAGDMYARFRGSTIVGEDWLKINVPSFNFTKSMRDAGAVNFFNYRVNMESY